MSAVDDFREQVSDIEAGNNGFYSKKWAPQNPGLAAAWVAFKTGILAAQRPIPPDMHGNRFGESLVDAGVTYLHSTAPPAPTPPPPAPPSAPLPTDHVPPIPVKGLIFEELFQTLDLSRWDVKDGRKSGGSATLWQKGNVTAGPNGLRIHAWKDAQGIWYSGEINGLAPLTYKGPHYIEALFQAPAGLGTWGAAIWGVDAPWGGLGVEIDYHENLGKEPNGYHFTVHDWNNPAGHLQSGSPPGGLLPKDAKGNPILIAGGDFHYVGGAVYDDHGDSYFENVLMATKKPSDLGGIWKFATTPLVPMIDLDMGGWGGTIDPALSSADLYVRALRVYAI